MTHVNTANAPKRPGVYFFLDARGKILYIGKAANLRSRLQSYFRTGADLAPAKRAMLEKITRYKLQETNSDIEALILEANLIKKYGPAYNVLFRDDKTYLSVGFTDEPFPRLVFVRRDREGLRDVIGPFTDSGALKQTLKLLRHVFPYATHKGFPKHCVWYDLGLCPLPKQVPRNNTQLSALKREYRRNIKSIKAVLEGKKTGLLATLAKEMVRAAKRQDFELAAKLRDQIAGLMRIFEHRTVIAGSLTQKPGVGLTKNLPIPLRAVLPHTDPEKWRIEGYDISNIQGTSATGSMVVFYGATPDKNEYRKFKIKTVRGANDVAMIKEVLSRRLNHKEWPMPDIILIDGGKPQLNAALLALGTRHWALDKNPVVMALAKREEEIYLPNRIPPIQLPNDHPFRLLLMHVRDESHRFAKKYHHTLRSIQ